MKPLDFKIKSTKREDVYVSHIIANILEDIVLENSNYPELDNKTYSSKFNTRKPPIIKLESYLNRIIKLAEIDETTLIYSLILIDGLCEKNNIHLTILNYHKILFISIVVSIKFLEDNFYTNEFYAKIGGMKLEELNRLEIEFLLMIDFRVFVSQEYFNYYRNSVFKQVSQFKDSFREFI